ncbi:WecB/TagA/CpsF family glycosyltransferase [Agrilactobacillus fermenti]|uniref:WecB/TagA/CpsF family glycosyltransferase n=1 Tax=Agrilactobacillus fermenti TaxID=2586909 RepID=UPI001E53E42A|nr:WecB/TagA/CpsF family glycosyltransferase [Agrilactobacillus fermenti]MCD2255112.1 WecB/TagA/CpsF family glycosyltransferase [Agrilactobacillus fermenti]
MSFSTVTVMDVPFIKATNQEFLTQLQTDIDQKKRRFIVTANPEIVLYAKDHPEYKAIIKAADYITPDGIGIIKAAQTIHQPLPERVTGYDTMVALLEKANTQHLRVYLLGAKPEVMAAVVTKVQQQYPGIDLVGYHDGYFKEDTQILADIHDKQPQLIFVGLGYPKQENWIKQNLTQAQAIWMGVGGSFDVLSGMTKRAPKVFQDAHLEWFYRLLKEPTRFKRMLAIPKFMWLMRKEKRA